MAIRYICFFIILILFLFKITLEKELLPYALGTHLNFTTIWHYQKCYEHFLTSIINLIIYFVNFLIGCFEISCVFLILCLLTYKQHGMRRVKDGIFTSTLNPTNKVNIHNLSLPLPGLIIFQTFYTFTHLLGLIFFFFYHYPADIWKSIYPLNTGGNPNLIPANLMAG